MNTTLTEPQEGTVAEPVALDRPVSRRHRSESEAAVRRGPLRELQRRRDAVAWVTPNWFASVMGTGIVAIAATSLPVQVPGQRVFARVVWVLATTMLVVLLGLTAAHWVRHRDAARSHLGHPAMSHFYGAFPMALLTVGTGSLLIGKDLLGAALATDVDWVLFTAGTVTGLLTAIVVPYAAFTRHDYTPESAFGGWLMPIVPPMVSATAGALLVGTMQPGQLRETLLLVCYAMFGLSLLTSVIVITLIWNRLVQHKVGDAAAVPTLWIVLGPLGQSITAAGLLGVAAQRGEPHVYAAGLQAFGLLYGVVIWGFAALWFILAAAITVRTIRRKLPFSLTWWSFTFPVGTCVTGTTGLFVHTGLDVFRVGAAGLYVFLLLGWATVFVRTCHGAWTGHLLRGPAPVTA